MLYGMTLGAADQSFVLNHDKRPSSMAMRSPLLWGLLQLIVVLTGCYSRGFLAPHKRLAG